MSYDVPKRKPRPKKRKHELPGDRIFRMIGHKLPEPFEGLCPGPVVMDTKTEKDSP